MYKFLETGEETTLKEIEAEKKVIEETKKEETKITEEK